jgi:TPR repeat protein
LSSLSDWYWLRTNKIQIIGLNKMNLMHTTEQLQMGFHEFLQNESSRTITSFSKIKKAANYQGSCACLVSWAYFNGIHPVTENLSKAIKYARIAKSLGYLEGAYYEGSILAKINPNDSEVRSLLRRCAASDSTLKYAAMLDLGCAWEKGVGGHPDKRHALRWYWRVFKNGPKLTPPETRLMAALNYANLCKEINVNAKGDIQRNLLCIKRWLSRRRV